MLLLGHTICAHYILRVCHFGRYRMTSDQILQEVNKGFGLCKETLGHIANYASLPLHCQTVCELHTTTAVVIQNG